MTNQKPPLEAHAACGWEDVTYSDAVEKIFHERKIKLGDSVRFKSGKKELEGVLMPRPDSGDGNIIILKLSNGYNVGVRFTAKAEIQKIKSGTGSFSFPKGDVGFDPSLKKVELIYTGGTIGSKIDYMTGGVYMLTKPEELLYDVPELAGIANMHVNNLMSIASEDMSYHEWQRIAEAAADAFNNGARGVVVTHGTDTMHYSSAALSFMLRNIGGPVVITGAQRSPDRGSSDAFMNMVCSTRLAVEGDFAEVGVCMHASSSDDWCNFIRGTKVRKMHTSRRDAFMPINSRPIARVSYGGKIEYLDSYRKPIGDGKKTEAITGFEPKVCLVKVYPNSDPEILEYYISKGYKGAILEGTGLGHAPVSTPHKEYNWLPGIKKAVDSGMVVGVTSQCLYGRVNSRVYRNLRLMSSAGATYCEDMLPEVAYVKLGWLLGNYKKAEVEKLLSTNIVGEIAERSEVNWFD